MESFYGGRQGNPFIIAKRFDGINIPQPPEASKPTYRCAYYALDLENSTEELDRFLQRNGRPIEKTKENQFQYTWKIVEKNNQIIYFAGGLSFQVETELAEGMVQCFKKGGSSTSEVNYGEYVLIDTHTDMLRLNDFENGQVFRRGMDYDNELGGAEYIGTIVGPQGLSPSLDMDSYNEVLKTEGAKKGAYTLEKGDLVAGFNGINYNDEIQYSWANLRDERGNVETCLFGFKFPYLVLEIFAEATTPYISDVENLAERLDDGEHPFYENWKIRVPKGKHGADITDLEIYCTYSNPKAIYYTNPQLTSLGGNLPDESYELTEYVKGQYASLYYLGELVYIKTEDTWKTKLRYKETSYEQSEEGEVQIVDLGPYNDIKEVTADEAGVVSVVYSYNEPTQIGQLKYILETVVTKNNSGYDIDSGHLLILFSDYGGTIKYFSPKYNKEITGYIDLGYVKGDPGPGLSVIGSFGSVSDLPSNPTTIPDYTAGDAVAVGTSLYIYDYISNSWVYIGSVSDVSPENIIRVSSSDSTEEDKVKDFGIWLVTESIKFVE